MELYDTTWNETTRYTTIAKLEEFGLNLGKVPEIMKLK